MKLNCKVGDLAIVVAPRSGGQCPDIGKFAEVLEFVGPGDLRTPDNIVVRRNGDNAPAWLIKYQRPALNVGIDGRMRTSLYAVMWDSRLRPIRDQPGEDETLSWAGLPQNVGVTT